VVMNVSTAAHLSDAIRYGLPITERVITVAGEVKNPCNIRVRVGTDLGSVIEQCGGLNEGVNKMIIGGPMMGHSVHSVHTPTEKATGGILLMRDEGKYTDDPENCIRCGRCVRACPAGLLPLNLYELSRKGMHELARDRYNVWDCIDCGACSYICPSKLPIVHMIRVTKHALNGK
ncbi:MAG: SLBB domain-containing protein, partial [Christensenellales bacterium]|jgi:electron transport complex protein RnfC